MNHAPPFKGASASFHLLAPCLGAGRNYFITTSLRVATSRLPDSPINVTRSR